MLLVYEFYTMSILYKIYLLTLEEENILSRNTGYITVSKLGKYEEGGNKNKERNVEIDEHNVQNVKKGIKRRGRR